MLKIEFIPDKLINDKTRAEMQKLMEEAFKNKESGRSATGFAAYVFMKICQREGVPYQLTVYPRGAGYYVKALYPDQPKEE